MTNAGAYDTIARIRHARECKEYFDGGEQGDFVGGRRRAHLELC